MKDLKQMFNRSSKSVEHLIFVHPSTSYQQKENYINCETQLRN